jgi:hypothetical protein
VTGLVVLGAVVLAGASIVWHTLRLGIGPVPTSARVRSAVLALVPPSTQGELHELGAGWGGLALALARRCPAARVVAWEASPVPWLVLKLRARVSGAVNIEVRRADLFSAPLGGAAGVVCYLFPAAMARLEATLRRELRAGSFVVTHTFALRGWTPSEVHRVDDLYRTPVFLYRA